MSNKEFALISFIILGGFSLTFDIGIIRKWSMYGIFILQIALAFHYLFKHKTLFQKLLFLIVVLCFSMGIIFRLFDIYGGFTFIAIVTTITFIFPLYILIRSIAQKDIVPFYFAMVIIIFLSDTFHLLSKLTMLYIVEDEVYRYLIILAVGANHLFFKKRNATQQFEMDMLNWFTLIIIVSLLSQSKLFF